jgi:paraquat-inducible protein B
VGIAAFGSVVVLTMLASLSFDAKLTWDSKEAQALKAPRAAGENMTKGTRTSMSEEEHSRAAGATRVGSAHAPRPCVARRRDWLPSLIWLIPIVAALVGITLVARILMERGPEIVLTFKTAEGLEAGKTAVKYKDVQIGLVQSLRLASDRSHVRVLVQFNKDAEGFTANDTRFWVVRPRLDTSGISGLNTLAVGRLHRRRCRRVGGDGGRVHRAGDAAHRHARRLGQAVPAARRDIGSLDVGSPVYFRRIKVGQWPPTNSTATAAASPCACSSTRRTTSSWA